MKKALLISLGTGSGVENGIVKSIRTHNPDMIVFIATKESKDTIQRIENILDEKLPNYKTIIIDNGNDIEKIYKTTIGVIKPLKEDYQVHVDFTSGTKAMSSGISLAAVATECETFTYVEGKRGENGRVITGTERVITLTPTEIFSDNKMRLAVEMFNNYRFKSCLDIIREVKTRVFDDDVLKDFKILEKLALAYSSWDKFRHKEAFERLRGINDDRISNNKGFLGILSNSEIYRTVYILVDLLNNANRRIEEGKYDDAVARLYRAIELIAQIKLLDYGLNDLSGTKFRLDDLKEKGVETEKYKKYSDEEEKLKLGLENKYRLLKDLGWGKADEVYLNNKEINGLLQTRNNSILAHGLEPVEKETAEKLFEYVKRYAREVFQDIDNLMEKATFPEI